MFDAARSRLLMPPDVDDATPYADIIDRHTPCGRCPRVDAAAADDVSAARHDAAFRFALLLITLLRHAAALLLPYARCCCARF